MAKEEGVDPEMEEVIEKVGRCTWWTWRNYFATSCCGVLNMWLLLVWAFIGHEIPFRCRISSMDDAGFSDEQQRNITNTFGHDVCEIPDLDYESLAKLPFEEAVKKAEEDRSKAETIPCTDYVFEEIGTSFMEEFKLVCGEYRKRSDLQLVVPLGKMLGSLTVGWFTDDYGRRTAFIVASVLYMCGSVIVLSVPYFWAFAIGRIVMGLGGTGCFYSGLTLMMEIVSVDFRNIIGVLYNFTYAVGMLTLTAIAYYLRQWRELLMAITIPVFGLFISWWVIPESPRWLATQGKRKKAWKILNKARRKRGEKIEEKVVEDDEPIVRVKQPCKERFKESLQLLKNFCVHLELLWRLLILFLVWFTTNLTYYILPLNAENFGIDVYLFMTFCGITEAISYSTPIIFLRYFGRRLLGFALFLLCGVAIGGIVFIPSDYEYKNVLTITFSMFGRICNSSVFAVVIVLTAELFPTKERGTALGICAAISHFAGMVSPYIVTFLGHIDPKIPAVIMSLTNVAVAFTMLLFPETKGEPLLDTLEEMEEKMKIGHKVSCLNICKFKWKSTQPT